MSIIRQHFLIFFPFLMAPQLCNRRVGCQFELSTIAGFVIVTASTMGRSSSGHKVFLVCSNVVLLFIGVSILILGIKMKMLLQVILLIDVPIIAHAVKAVVATGTLISFSGITGIIGSFYEILWLISVNLASMGLIVVMEFGLGVTLLFAKKAIETYIGTADCSQNCATVLDTVVLDYALPSTGLMMIIILVEAMMIYSAVRLYFYIRDAPKIPLPAQNVVIQNVQMQDVASPLQSYVMSPHSPQTFYTAPTSFSHQASPLFLQSVPPRPPKPPLYSSLPTDEQNPPSYLEVSGTFPKMLVNMRAASLNSV